MIRSKVLFLFLLAIWIPALLGAQVNHFIYLQTESKQPFYAKLDKKILSSSASGYLIIPKLKDGTYNIEIGFPRSENSVQTYTCDISNKDAGYLIKNFGDKGWGLFNLQTLDVVMAGDKAKKTEVAKVEKTDDFSNMLSEVVNDPSIKQADKPVVKENTEAVAKPAEKETAVIPSQDDKPAAKQTGRSTVIKKQSISSESGVEVIYIDVTGDKQDTVKIFIPADKESDTAGIITSGQPAKVADEPKTESNEKANATIANPVDDNKTEQVKEEEKPKEKNKQEETKTAPGDSRKFLPIEMKAENKPGTPAETPASVSPMINSDCKAYAADEDFLKLRKKMAGEDSDDAMIAVAQKFLKAKCYTTDQIKNLSFLFLKDAGKYRFFDLAYQFVSDSHNFSTLESQLTDPYYISRFKAMVRH